MAVGVIGGIAIIGVVAVRSISKVEDFQRVSVPGDGTVRLDETGGYTVYHEYDGASDGGFGPSLSVELVGPDGSVVGLDSYGSTDVTYSWESYEGVAVFSFQADEVGDYQVSVGGSVGTVAVGRGIGSELAGGVVGGMLFGFFTFVGGLVIVIVTAVKRGRRRREQLYSSFGARPGPTWGAPGGYQPPGAYAPPGAYPPPGGAQPPGPYPPPGPPGAPPGPQPPR
jgi:hypothetical protein